MSGRFARQQAKQRAQKFRRLDADHFHAHLFSSSLSPQKQQPGCRQRHTQRNQKKFHRQAQKNDQYAGKHQEDARHLPEPAAHAHPPPAFILCAPRGKMPLSAHAQQQDNQPDKHGLIVLLL
ncbi:MAG: hypothetical protein ACLUMK_10775, partial [Christensenellales bacterium]